VSNNDETIAKLLVREYNLGDKQIAKKYNYVVCILDCTLFSPSKKFYLCFLILNRLNQILTNIFSVFLVLFKQMSKTKAEAMFLNAVAQNYIHQIHYFVEKKIDINATNPKDSRTALQIAAAEGNNKYNSVCLNFCSFHISKNNQINNTASVDIPIYFCLFFFVDIRIYNKNYFKGNYSVVLFLLKQPNVIITRRDEWINQTAYYLIKKSPQTKVDRVVYSNLLRFLVRPGSVLL
jgi:hypothetical protein